MSDSTKEVEAGKKRKSEREEKDIDRAEIEAQELSKKEKKRLKKEKRERERLPVAEGALAVDGTAVSIVSDDAVDAEQEQSRKKKKHKKEKKETEEGSSPTQQEPGLAAISISKKKKVAVVDFDDNDNSSIGKFSTSNTAAAAFRRNFIEHETTRSMSVNDVSQFRSQGNIAVYPEAAASSSRPIVSFEYLIPSVKSYCPEISKYISSKAFKTPSPIQAECWPFLLQGLDAIGIASTGSGKTLAFLVPALIMLKKLGPQPDFSEYHRGKVAPKPRVLIVAPTRELALQSHDVVQEIGGVKGVCIFGGVPKPQQKADLRNGADVVVATPGRLLDLMEEGALSLSDIKFLVLDEADRMLDDGFGPAIRKILSACPPGGDGPNQRQTVMFSATWPEEIRGLAESFLRPDVIRVVVGSEELSANHRVEQIVECVESHEKNKKLVGLLEKYHKSRKNRILIFVLYKKEAVTLQSTLEGRGYSVGSIHGDKSQHDRFAALESFKRGEVPLLIATDVAARGLDIPQVEYVLNYSFPLTVEDYVHRIGRTGRGGASGVSHTFFTEADKTLAGALVGVLQEAGQKVPQEIYKYPLITKKKTSKLYGDFGPKSELSGKKATKITFDEEDNC